MQPIKKITVLIGVVIAVLMGIDLPDEPLLSSQIVSLPGNLSTVFTSIRRGDRLPMLFPWFTAIIPSDDRPWGKGKLFKATAEYMLLGSFQSFVRIVDWNSTKIEFEGDMYLQPRVICNFKETSDKPVYTKVEIKIYSRRQSAFFQWIVRPILRFFLYHQQLQKLFMLQYSF